MVKCHESRVHTSICANRRLQLSGASVSGMEVHDSSTLASWFSKQADSLVMSLGEIVIYLGLHSKIPKAYVIVYAYVRLLVMWLT